MKPIIQKEERRQNPRFKVQGMVIAVAHPSSLPPGTIKEISQSGLAFQYRENGNSWMIPQDLDIIWADYLDTHHLEKLPVRVVSDSFIEKEENINGPVIRRLAIAFENLTLQQENQIGRLIKARGSVPL